VNKIIVLAVFMCIPFYSMSQALMTPQQNIGAVSLLKRSNIDERKDWIDEANRIVEAFYKHLKVLTNTEIDRKRRKAVADRILDLFASHILEVKICDNILLDDKQKKYNYDIEDFLKQIVELDEINFEIINVNPPPESNDAFFNIDATTKIYEITETIKFKTHLGSKTYDIKKTIVVHFIFIENPVNGINFIIRLGSITCK